jgi:CRISPR system Cascade subunit CasE
MSEMWLIRAQLRRDASVAALAPLLMPQDDNERALAAHRLIWSLMPADAAARRDFLWRDEGHGRFMVLAGRPPGDNTLFDVQAQSFAPHLAQGDRLRFVLRANPTASLSRPGRRSHRVDVVMQALHGIPQTQRAAERPALIREAGQDWLTRLGQRHGFTPEPDSLDIDGYRLWRIPRTGAEPIRLATLECGGVLRVDDPVPFLSALFAGFGRGRAFGCGLMLIRRA